MLRYGIPVKEDVGTNYTTVRLIDWKNWEKEVCLNEFFAPFEEMTEALDVMKSELRKEIYK
jgi:type I restriction enzyme R subunit